MFDAQGPLGQITDAEAEANRPVKEDSIRYWRARALRAEAVIAKEYGKEEEIIRGLQDKLKQTEDQVVKLDAKIAEMTIETSNLQDSVQHIELIEKECERLKLELEHSELQLRQIKADFDRVSVDDRYARIKRAFSRRYHPNSKEMDGKSSQLSEKIRSEVFKEFWQEFRDIDLKK